MNASIKRERLKPSSSSLRTITSTSNYNFATRIKSHICSNSCLRIVYLSCATLISASFIIECILLHLIIVPYLSESIFEEGMCKYSSSRREELSKRCENKCSKERSTFPCLQLKVIFTPIRVIPYQRKSLNHQPFNNQELIKKHIDYQNYYYHNNNNPLENPLMPMLSSYSTASSASAATAMAPTTDVTNYTLFYDFESSESRMVYLYDYFSTFATHKTSRCSTSPCHRREEDNKLAVEEFKRDLSRRNVFRCYAPPLTTHSLNTVSSYIPSSSQPSTLSNSSTVSTSKSSSINRHLPLHSQADLKDAAAILHRLYTPSMFMHGLLWPGGIFLTALIILLFTYFTDSCEAWAGDKTVIA
ncbi:hypothetical protein MN116_002077 [Schistosoma mekongi]|uniref:Calcium activated potassium channel subunit n=1 Tax=Schistosoma mekongi TaxID=38744 RepID=A0AAE1ZJI2_SCHME|nr:hypothetical protein MN116_002077 [Schistosoma mekongi]